MRKRNEVAPVVCDGHSYPAQEGPTRGLEPKRAGVIRRPAWLRGAEDAGAADPGRSAACRAEAARDGGARSPGGAPPAGDRGRAGWAAAGGGGAAGRDGLPGAARLGGPPQPGWACRAVGRLDRKSVVEGKSVALGGSRN